MGVRQVYKQPGYRESSGIGHGSGDILEGGAHGIQLQPRGLSGLGCRGRAV